MIEYLLQVFTFIRMKSFMRMFFLQAVLSNHILLAQNEVSGTVLNIEDAPLERAAIYLTPHKKKEPILKYVLTNAEGKYSLSLPEGYDSLTLYCKKLGYITEERPIKNQTQTQNFSLFPEVKETTLKEVVVETPAIIRRGDTLVFNVDKLKRESDRSIEDLMRRLPGVEIKPDGTIMYEGKAINKYYIEGLDALEGKYKIANQNLQVDKVKEIQFIENHQPIKILDSLVQSDQAGVNIKLKKGVTTAGRAEILTGGSPWARLASIVPMLFTKKVHFINTLKHNNIGRNYIERENIFVFRSSGINTSPQHLPNWLHLIQPNPPSFDEDRWLFNNATHLQTNSLFKLGSDWQVKPEIAYTNDYQTRQGFAQTTYPLANQPPVTISETSNSSLFFSQLSTKLVFEKNTKKFFGRNDFQFKRHWNEQFASLWNTNTTIEQRLDMPLQKLTNTFDTHFKFLGKVVNFTSMIDVEERNRMLTIQPGVYENLLNSGVPYSATQQQVNQKQWYAIHGFGFYHRTGRWDFEANTGIENRWITLTTNIFTDFSTSPITSSAFQNNLDYQNHQWFLNNRVGLSLNKASFSVRTPIKLVHVSFSDQLIQSDSRILFEPNASFSYRFNSRWRYDTSISYGQDMADYGDIYRGFILSNYRSIQNALTPIMPFNQSLSYSNYVEYSHIVRGWFVKAEQRYFQTLYNLISTFQINADGSATSQPAPIENLMIMQDYSLSLSKNLRKWKSFVRLKYNYNVSNSENFWNGSLQNNIGQSHSIEFNADAQPFDALEANYLVRWNSRNFSVNGQAVPDVILWEQYFRINFFPAKQHMLWIKGEHYFNFQSGGSNNQSFLFFNAGYRFSTTKPKIDYEIQALNLTNIENFGILSTSATGLYRSDFLLRPRQFLVGIKFGF